MLRTTTIALLLCGLGGFTQPAMAERPPSKDAEPLSKILQSIEEEDGFSHFQEIEWEEDGYWEIEYFTIDRVEVEIKVVPTRQASPTPGGAAGPSAEPSGPQPLTRDACEKAGLFWNDRSNVCGG